MFLHRLFFFHSYLNLPLFTVAPKPTSSDVLMLNIKDSPTTQQSTWDNKVVQNPDPATSTTEEMTSGVVLSDLRVIDVTSSSVSLAWSATDKAFDSFLVELSASSQANVTTLPGNVRKAKIEALSPSTHYDITLKGLAQGKHSLPLKGFATTGTGISHMPSSHSFLIYT